MRDTASISGAFDARTSAAVVPRPARPRRVRASVRANSVWVTLSIDYSVAVVDADVSRHWYISRMLKRLCPLLVVLVMLPAPAFAWGTEAHRYIMAKAIDILPPEVKPFFEHFRQELLLRTIDPDLYRT